MLSSYFTSQLPIKNTVTSPTNSPAPLFQSSAFQFTGALQPFEPEFNKLQTNLYHRVAASAPAHHVVRELMFKLEQESPFTAAHSQRVAIVTRRLATGFIQDTTSIERIYLAALLHDVGKLIIPSHILEKKSALSQPERKLIQTHPIFTDMILASFTSLSNIHEFASLHHEYLDGSGYPYGLSENQLPLGIRIITVADIFVALTEDRPYRRGFCNMDALHKLSTLAEQGMIDKLVVQIAIDKLLT